MITTEQIIILILAAVAIVSVVINHIDKSNAIKELKEQVKELERANHWRMSYKSTRELEGAQAAGAVAEKYAIELVDIIRNMQAHLHNAHYPNKVEKGN